MRGWTTSDVKNLIKTFRSETFSYLPKKVSDQNVFIKFFKNFYVRSCPSSYFFNFLHSCLL